MADNKPVDKFIAKRAVRNEQISQTGKPGFSTGKAKLLRQQTASDKVQRLNPQGKTMGQIAKEVASKSKAPVIKVNSNPNPTPAKSMRGPVDSGKYSWSANEWNSKEGTGPHGEPTYNSKAPIKPIKVNSNPVPTRTSGLSGVSGKLGGQHAGGHSDVAGARGARGGGGFGGGPESFGGGGGLPRENM